MSSDLEKVLLSPKSLKENSLEPHEATLQKVIKLLSLGKLHRNSKQLLIIQALTRKVKFFIQKIEELGEAIHYDCCKAMMYEFVPNGEYVFKCGEKGNKFYIILEGIAKVIVPIIKDDIVNMITVAQLYSGMAFGELALIKDQPRSASILCAKDCHFAVLVKEDYLKILGKAESRILDMNIDFLKGIPYFTKWTKKKLEKLTYYFSPLKFMRKQVVFSVQGQPKYVYIVKSGEFELTKSLTLNETGSKEKNFTVKVALLGHGEIFGEEEVINNELYKNNCTCYSTFGELMCITAENFLLKIYQKNEPTDDIKRQVKYIIRNSRLDHFRKFLVEKDNKGSITKKISNTPSITSGIKRKSPSLTDNPKWKYNPLSERELKKIKLKAMGDPGKVKIYININVPFESSKTEETHRSLSPKEHNKSLNEMTCHRPGGYYRGKLKKPKTPFKTISDYLI
ncbi:hypothetical protein SteCoe_14267 [Stentor coeruleus]|uniref:Cyclic nucleotide-binding domain-containing protein n=1 Tax=Stentor coeruleus TaxID=5963 RepID=A0A1R2C6E6_9CILI|nr:hypothetical protein SteCoe_14267 [Stentor coeruleus]